MNKEIEVKKREWVKTAAIIFLAVMLVLLFFSNTIMNRSLPEVAAQYTQSSTINARIRGSGTVTANESYEVIAKQVYTVSEVRVRLGDEVSTGDVLIVLSRSGSEELEAAEEELRQAEIALERLLLTDNPDSSYAAEYRAIQNARADLSAAQDARTQAKTDVDRAKDDLNQARDDRDAISYDSAAYRSAESAISAAQTEVDIKATEEEIAQRALSTHDEINGYDIGGVPPEGVDLIRDGLVIAFNVAKQAHTDAQNALDQLRIDTNFTALESARTRWMAADDAVTIANDALTAANNNLSSANRAVTSAQQGVEAANEALAEAQRTAQTADSLFDIDVREKNREIELLREKVEELSEEGTSAEITAAVSGKITLVDISPGQNTVPDKPLMLIEVTDRGYTVNIPVTNDQSTRVRVGDTAQVDRGWWSWGEPLTGVLTAIRPNPENPAAGRLLVFNISGEGIESGTSLNIEIAQMSENYSVVVPNSAIRSDTNGDFVLVVETRTSPLRNRYIATRVDVSILASDDINTAISAGGLTGRDFVITTSTSPIEPGMQVRLVDN